MPINLKLRCILLAVAGTLLAGAAPIAAAGSASADDLLNILHQEGIINDAEFERVASKLDNLKNKPSDQVQAAWRDGITFSNGDNSNQLSIGGRVQLDYRDFQRKDAQNADQMDVRRAYVGVKGKLYNDYDFAIVADFGQGKTGDTANTQVLDVAYFGINWWSQAKFRFGQFDMPFGLDHQTNDLFSDFAERSFIDALTASKERGVLVHGAPIKGVYYGLGASAGRGKNVSNADPQKEGLDINGRLTANLADIFGVKDAVYHFGIDYSNGDLSLYQKPGSSVLGGTNKFAAPSGVTEARGMTFFKPTAIAPVNGDHLTRQRYGLETAIARGPVKFQSEWFRANYEGRVGGNGYDKDINTWYASIHWFITGESFAPSYKDNVWGRIKPKNDFSLAPSAKSGTGAVELSLRYSNWDGSDFADTSNTQGNVAAGTPTGAHAWTAGVNWLLNSNAKLMLNYVDTTFEDGAVDIKNSAGTVIGTTRKEDAIVLRAQLDF